MTNILLSGAALLIMCGVASAGATLEGKDTNSGGSAVGQSSSSYTGNGQYVGGHDAPAGADQTTGPNSRPNAMISNGVFNGNANGLAK